MNKALFFYTEPPEAPPGTFPEAGVPAVPWYMPQSDLAFVDLQTFKLCPRVYLEYKEVDLDALHAALVKHYPGIPSGMHEDHLLRTATVANKLHNNIKESFKLVSVDDVVTIMRVDGKAYWDFAAIDQIQGTMQYIR